MRYVCFNYARRANPRALLRSRHQGEHAEIRWPWLNALDRARITVRPQTAHTMGMRGGLMRHGRPRQKETIRRSYPTGRPESARPSPESDEWLLIAFRARAYPSVDGSLSILSMYINYFY